MKRGVVYLRPWLRHKLVLRIYAVTKWVGFRRAADQKLSRNLLLFLPLSNLVAFLAKTVYTDRTYLGLGNTRAYPEK